MEIKNQIIEGKHNKPILVDVFYNQNGELKPVVVFAHGFKGFKDWGHFNKTAEMFAEAGFVFVKFNFSHNGSTVSQPDECVDIEAFGNNNFSIEMDDLGSVFDWISEKKELKSEIIPSSFYLIGHSRGGGIAILKTAEDNRIKKLITWASVADFGNKYSKEQIEYWREKGKLEVTNGRTGQVLPLYFQLCENYFQNIKRLSIPDATKKIDIPFLIIHGTNDEAVVFEEAIQLNNWCKTSQLIDVQNAGHTFEAKHPFMDEEYPENLKFVINETIQFLKN